MSLKHYRVHYYRNDPNVIITNPTKVFCVSYLHPLNIPLPFNYLTENSYSFEDVMGIIQLAIDKICSNTVLSI